MTAPVITRRPGLLRLCTVRDGNIVVRTDVADLAAARDLAIHFAEHEGTVPGAVEAAAALEIGDDVQITARGGFLLLRSQPTTEDLQGNDGRLVRQQLEASGVTLTDLTLADRSARVMVDDVPLASRVLEAYGWTVRPVTPVADTSAVWVCAPGAYDDEVATWTTGCEPGIRC